MYKSELPYSAPSLPLAARYDLLRSVAEGAARQRAQILAFGLGPDRLRLVTDVSARRLWTPLRISTAKRQLTRELLWHAGHEAPVHGLAEAVAWAHAAPLSDGECPLSTPWSSHRDMLGFRRAPFYDPARDVDASALHARMGGQSPEWSPIPLVEPTLGYLYRLAAAVLGLLPADRRCTALFVQLGRRYRHEVAALAAATQLTPRRIRQLSAPYQPMLAIAERCLHSPALCRVP